MTALIPAAATVAVTEVVVVVETAAAAIELGREGFHPQNFRLGRKCLEQGDSIFLPIIFLPNLPAHGRSTQFANYGSVHNPFACYYGNPQLPPRVSLRKLSRDMPDAPRILYCHCQYAQVVPPEVKEAVLKKLSDSGMAFDAVADLCEMSARQDPSLKRLADGGPVKVAACFPRAVKWLFHTAKADLPLDTAEVLNMRVQSAEEVCAALFNGTVNPNLPKGKVTGSDAPKAAPAS